MVSTGVKLEGEQVLCRFYLSNYVSHHHAPVFELIVEKALKQHMAGVTVLKGAMGFIGSGPLMRENLWAMSSELPVIVEVVDRHDKIFGLIQLVQAHLRPGMITLERARVVYYRTLKPKEGAPNSSQMDQPDSLKEMTMNAADEGVLLRIFLGDGDRDPKTGHPLYQSLVEQAMQMRMDGATVLRGTMGFGKHASLHAAKLLDIATDLPVVIEIVDSQTKIDAFLPVVDDLVGEGLVTMEKVRVLKFAGKP